MFCTVDSIGSLFKFHCLFVHELSSKHKIARFYLDEVHTLFSEQFRMAYDNIRNIGQFGVPLTALSGTLPGPLVESLYEYLGLRLDRLITGRTLLGNFPKGFQIETVQSSQLVHDTVICTKGKVTTESSTCVHVIVATKQQCTDIAQCLKQSTNLSVDKQSTNLSVEALSSDEPSSRQEAVAQQWRSGDIRILVSTKCALCGNENHNCRHVIVCGMIYSLMNIVQAVGRLRPSQRKPDGSVTLLYSTGHMARDLQEDQTLRLLEDKGLLTGSESRAHLELVFGSSSIAKWLAERSCRVQGLSRQFGLEVDCCGVCDWCVEQSNQSGHSRVRERVRNEDIDAERLNPIWQGLQENALCARRQDAMVKAVCPMEHASTVVSQVTREDSAESISKQS